MKSYTQISMDTDIIVSVQELQFLLRSILENHANIRIKYRLNGDIWADHFFRILMVTEKGAIFNDERTNKISSIKFLDDITHFVLEKTYETYQSNSPYTIN